MGTKLNYIIIKRYSILELQKAVNALWDEKYRPVGGMCIAWDVLFQEMAFYQSMKRRPIHSKRYVSAFNLR